MSQNAFSLAVVKGVARGTVVRTNRKRISVGSATENDLVVNGDLEISDRHFLVLIDRGRWRIHTFSAESSITVDRRWTHPETGQRGAIIIAANTEILVFPGDLDDRIIDSEIAKRITSVHRVLDPDKTDYVTMVHKDPVEFDSEEMSNETTRPVNIQARDTDLDLVEMSQMPTVAAGRPPDDIRQAARVKLDEERKPISSPSSRHIDDGQTAPNDPVNDLHENATIGVHWQDGRPSSQPIDGGLKPGTAWDRARRAKPEQQSQVSAPQVIPEIISEPESQMGAVPNLGARPVSGGNSDVVIEVEEEPSQERRGAWGDPQERRRSSRRDPNRRSSQNKNIWGDSRSRSQPPEAKSNERPEERSAWGDKQRVPSSRALQKRPAPPAGIQIAIQDLEARAHHDPALRILIDPDGEFSTGVRLLGTRLDELARSMGYRAYMFTSAEPLTGKTTAVLNLAFALAEDTNRRVALIEGNFRYPRFSEILGVDEDIGIIPVLEGRKQLSESVVKLSDRNLVILPAGGQHRHPAEVLASPRFKTLVAELANTVDVALVDAPSVKPFADTNLILPMVDAAFFVVADGLTRAIWIDQATAQIGKRRVLGALLNRLPKILSRPLAKERKARLKKSD